MEIIKRNGRKEEFNSDKIKNAIKAAFNSIGYSVDDDVYDEIVSSVKVWNEMTIEDIQDQVIETLRNLDYNEVADSYLIYRYKHHQARVMVEAKKAFIEKYKQSSNTANATIDDNSNVANKNIGILNAEGHKEENILISRAMITSKLKELFPDFDSKQYEKDLEHHIIYKHDESSFMGAIAPYCCSISMYPFLNNGIKGLGGLSASPKNLDSFCGIFINLVFAISGNFAGAIATPEFLMYFDYFARREWGEDYYLKADCEITTPHCIRHKTIKSQIRQHFQQVVYSINQPTAARGMQSAFWNLAYFDKPFFDAMFGNFVFPDMTSPVWDSLNWLQKEFMQWFNEERLKTILTFPVESFALIYKDGNFIDKENADFVAEEYARGHSFFTYISDTADSLSSCCRLKNKVDTKEFNFTNGNMGVETGSKSVITLNLNRIIQDWCKSIGGVPKVGNQYDSLRLYLREILQRVYKYHITYNECLWDMYDTGLLPAYKEGFISLNKQYLTIGLNGLNQAAEFLGIECSVNKEYQDFCQAIFGIIKESNSEANGTYFGHKVTFNTECVPAESAAIKNYNWDKADGYWVPSDTNLYASYIFKPNDPNISVLDKIILHGKNYIGDYLDGGSAAHINLSEHLSVEQYKKLLKFAAEEGCQYFTFNIPNCECENCGFIAKQPFEKCPKCGETKRIVLWDRIIGYLTKIKNWSEGRQIEQKTRVYSKEVE
jgi:ribonucleoside-triphosphate reductase